MRLVFDLGSDGQPEVVGEVDFILKKGAEEPVGLDGRMNGNLVSRRNGRLEGAETQSPHNVVAAPGPQVMWTCQVESSERLGLAHFGAAVGIVVSLEGGVRSAGEGVVPAREQAASGRVEPLREWYIGGRRRKELVSGLAFAVGKQVAFGHQGIGGGETPIPSEAAVHPPPAIVPAQAAGLNRIARPGILGIGAVRAGAWEIGRASCRERVEISVV